jgi:hypothetical protein
MENLMKNVAMFALAAGLVACGQNSDNSDVSARPGHLSNVYTFSVDRRPVDGNFESIKIKKDRYGTYTASHRVITAGFGSPVSDTTEELGTGLTCAETKRGRILYALKCSVDMRPADGELIELSLTRDAEGFYDATLRKATYATLMSPATDVTYDVAFGLSLQH